ncbi:hypothetical protein ES332_A06G088900v1 [Gossypium tomentosum]|uniref:Uncharacterized protein n=1 Tax=Gossypium tomentosum TaxID=34277 RepID=A0A5D2Q4M5_GOSTO|nr:hypothetical protein ES332_A06G088900v1 [Gossypium tomentosum]
MKGHFLGFNLSPPVSNVKSCIELYYVPCCLLSLPLCSSNPQAPYNPQSTAKHLTLFLSAFFENPRHC